MPKTYFSAIETDEGRVHVLTKRRWWGLFPRPHTSIMPANLADLGRLGVVFYWTTSDSTMLEQLHNIAVQSVEKFGLHHIREAAESARVEPMAGFLMFCEILPPPASQHIKRIW